MLDYSKKSSFIFMFISGVVMCCVLILQHAFDLQPCEWCIYQRYPYIVLLLINGIWWFRPVSFWIQSALNLMILCVNVILPFINLLIEKGYLQFKCPIIKPTVINAFLKMIGLIGTSKSCATVDWTFLGGSLAQWHFLFAGSILLIYIGTLIHVRRRHS